MLGARNGEPGARHRAGKVAHLDHRNRIHIRRLKRLAGLGAAGFLLAGAVFLYLRESEDDNRRQGAARLMSELMSGKAAVGGPFTLTDPAGAARSLADFRGKIVLLYFGYAGCPDICPTDLSRIGAMLNSLGAEESFVQALFVTLDPERDTPGVLREYAAAFHPRLIALRGGESETRRIATSYKVFYEKVPRPDGGYFIDHAAFTFLLDREGRYIAFFPPGTHADRMAVMVREAIAGTR